MISMASSMIPTIDLEPFLKEGNEDAKKKAREEISQASAVYGFFQVVNHGVPLHLMTRALNLSMEFFNNPPDKKLNSISKPGALAPAGYFNSPDHSKEGNEHLLILNPSLGLNVYPETPAEFRKVMEESFPYFTKLALLIESILSLCLGLSPDFLREYNNDRSNDFLLGLHYFSAEETENNGKSAHEDGNCITFVFQDEVGGLEVLKNGQWIPITPAQGTLVVNIGDVIQVLSNNKFKSATHRVVRPKGKSRYSYGFFHNLHGDKWVEPLPQFTKEIGESPKYRGFMYKEYIQLRIRNRTNPPAKPEDLIHITHYSIST